jgi:hypothetical protein
MNGISKISRKLVMESLMGQVKEFKGKKIKVNFSIMLHANINSRETKELNIKYETHYIKV